MMRVQKNAENKSVAKRTVVTACDSNYIWGAFLLIASLRRFNVDADILVLGRGLGPKERESLERFDRVQVIKADPNLDRSMNLHKAEAILSADTELITWMDSDCMVNGDVTAYLAASESHMQIRVREQSENCAVFAKRYAPADVPGTIPEQILRVWEEDVGERDNPLIDAQSVTNCFTVHRAHKPFIKKWKEQISRVVTRKGEGVVNSSSRAYFMTDESVMTSLLAFANGAPQITDYLLDKDPSALLVHFGENPKPWVSWNPRSYQSYDLTVSTVRWAVDQGIAVPADLPWALNSSYRWLAKLTATVHACTQKSKQLIKKLLVNG